MISEEKQSLRARMRSVLAGMTIAQRAEASQAIRNHLESSALWMAAQRIIGFQPMASEPLWIAEEFPAKTLAFPRLRNEEIEPVIAQEHGDFAPGQFGIHEPSGNVLMERPDLILVPGLAFDRQGGRLGRGKGYYDRFLVRMTAKKIGVCFACQLVEDVPLESHDHPLDGVVTEEGLILRDKVGLS
jgi:5-formyltetrahydrofolate cyclo-ligase